MAKDPKKTLEELNEELSHFEDQIISVADLLSQRVRDAIEGIRDESAAVADIFEKKLKKSIRDISKETDTTLKNTLKLLDGSAKLEDIEKARQTLTLKKLAAERNMLNNAKYMLEATQDQAKVDQFILDTQNELNEIYEQQNVHLTSQEVLAKKIQKNMGITGGIMQGMTKIPILGNLIKSQEVLAKIQQAAAKEGATRMSTFKAGVKGVGSSVASSLTDPTVGIGLLAKLLQFIVDAMFAASKRVNDIGKNLGVSKAAASGIYENLKGFKTELSTSLRTTENIVEAFNDISQLTGFSTIATTQQIDAQIKLTKQIGLAKDEALGMQETFALNNIEADKGVKTTFDQIAAFANQNKIVADGKQIFNEISKTSKIIQLNFRGNYKELVNTVLETKKLGLSLEQVSKIGKSLLNFEQSIASEIESEVVTGRELNLEEARRYALNHDLAGLTKEIAKNIGSAEEFSRMNVIQQESIAAAVGMSAEELGDSLYKQQIIEKTAGNFTNELREQAKLAKNKKEFDKAIALEKQAEAIEKGILEGKSLEEAKLALDAQTSFENSLQRVKDLFADMVNEGLIDRIAAAVESLVTSLESVSKRGITQTLLGGAKEESSLQNLKKAGYNVEEGTGLFGSGAFKRTKLYDKDGNLVETAIGSGGIQSLEEKYARKFAEGGIVTKRINNATIGEAGPEGVFPLTAFYAKFDELIAAVNKGGNVYLDREKVGTSFAVGTREI